MYNLHTESLGQDAVVRLQADSRSGKTMVQLGSLMLNGTPRIAVGFTDASSDLLQEAQQKGVDIAEIRIDQFQSFDRDYVVEQVKRFSNLPTIATIRIPTEGGHWTGSEADRAALFKAVLPHVDAIDIELCAQEDLDGVIGAAKSSGKLVVLSFHEFAGTPDESALQKIADESVAVGADVVKIATQVTGLDDLRVLAHLLVSRHDLNLIVIGMGGKGVSTRLLFPSLGSLMTYAYLGQPTAPGQLRFEEMCRLMRLVSPAYNDAKINELKLLEDA